MTSTYTASLHCLFSVTWMANCLCTCMTVLKKRYAFHFCFVGPLGQQQFIFICWRVISGGVAPKTGTGEVRAWSSTQWLGWPGVPQVQLCPDIHSLLGQISFLSELVVTCLFTSDITEEDLEEAGVLDPAHKQILLQSLKQQHEQQQKIIWFYDPNKKTSAGCRVRWTTVPFVWLVCVQLCLRIQEVFGVQMYCMHVALNE